MTNDDLIRAGWLSALAATAALVAPLSAQAPDTAPIRKAAAAMTWRAIGPALMSGRIADIEVNPRDQSVWYVAAGSGGVWKTTNAGTTWTPVFDDQD